MSCQTCMRLKLRYHLLEVGIDDPVKRSCGIGRYTQHVKVSGTPRVCLSWFLFFRRLSGCTILCLNIEASLHEPRISSSPDAFGKEATRACVHGSGTRKQVAGARLDQNVSKLQKCPKTGLSRKSWTGEELAAVRVVGQAAGCSSTCDICDIMLRGLTLLEDRSACGSWLSTLVRSLKHYQAGITLDVSLELKHYIHPGVHACSTVPA